MSESTVEAVQNVPSSRRFRNPLNPPIAYLAKRWGGSQAKELERFLRFACVGVTGAIIDLGTLTVLQATVLPPASSFHSPLVESVGFQPPVSFVTPLHLNVALATTIAFLVAVISNYIWTSTWVYPETKVGTRQLIQFTFISVVGWSGRTLWITSMYVTIGELITPMLLPIIHIFHSEYIATPLAEKKIGTLVAQLIAMGVVMLWNFFANRYWTFNDVD